MNSCGNQATTPRITTTTFAHPQALDASGGAPANWNPAEGRYARGNIQYVSGGAVRLDFTTDGCTFVKGVRIGSRALTTTYTDGYWYSAVESSSSTSAHSFVLWIFYPPNGDGSSDDVVVEIGRSAGAATTRYSFPLVRVKAVDATLVDAPIGISGAEIYNEFANGLYAKFNGAQNSTMVGDRRVYGYDPRQLSVHIDNTGIWFSFSFKADVANWCDPSIRVTGTFTIDANAPGKLGLSVRWVNPVSSNVDWGWCGALGDIPIAGIVADIVYGLVGDDGAAGSVQGTITDMVAKSLPDTSNVNLFLHGTKTLSNELRVFLDLPFPSIEIAVPYDAFDMARTPTRLPMNTHVALLAAGLGMNDAVAAVSPAASLWSGPDGVPLHTATSVPYARTVARSGALIDPPSDVGRLLARVHTGGIIIGTDYTARYDSGCVVGTSRFSGGSVAFGVNDTAADAARLRAMGARGYSVRAIFDAPATACVSTTPPPVVSL